MRGFKQVISAVLSLSVVLSGFSAAAARQTLAEQLSSKNGIGSSIAYSESPDYADVLQEYEENGYRPALADRAVRLEGADFAASDHAPEAGTFEGRQNAVKWTKDTLYLEWKVDIPADGLYSLRLEYRAVDDGIASFVRSLTVDGKTPFDEAEALTFYRLFRDDGKPIINSVGDEVAPDVAQCFEWQTQNARDDSAAYGDALRFYFTAGRHTVRLQYISGDMLLAALELFPVKEYPAYERVKKTYEEKGLKPADDVIRFEAEGDAVESKNSSTLRAIASTDPACTPFTYGKSRINTVGGTLWQGANTAITYRFTVKKDGLYALALRLLMNFRDGIPSYRSIAIDGEIPFREWEAYRFAYDKSWRTEVLSDSEGDPYLVYLSAGEHTVTFTVAQGELGAVTAVLQKDSDAMSQMLLKIKMIIGQNPDVNYDYELEKQIPDLIPTLETVMGNMKFCMEEFERICGRKQSKYYQLKSFLSQLESMKNDPFTISSEINSLEEIITTYGSWFSELEAHPLTLDFVELAGDTRKTDVRHSNFFQRLYASLVNFVISFQKDYNNISVETVGDVEIKDTISVWVSRGTKWCQIMKQLIDFDFTPSTGIAVNLNVLPAGQLNAGGANALLLSITSGRAPDVATGVSASSIGEFAMRNALVDLSDKPDFETVKSRFKDEHFVQLTYNDKVFALPETQHFMCMIYRKDIFNRLGLSVPDTWDRLYDRVIPILNQNNMQFYVPLTAAGYDMFLYQLGGEMYHDDLQTTALDSDKAYRALVEYSNLYALYGVPKTANFYNRFRSGEMPAGIVDYNLLMTVKSAAGDIRGKWGLALIPGHKQADGTVNRAHSSLSAECCMITAQSEKQDAAWQFLQWWTSDEVQLKYANQVESMLGQSARWVSANWSAFTSLAWEREEIDVITQSFTYAKQAPVVLGGYYVTRHITNALNRVVVSGINPRDSIEAAVEDINRELLRRRKNVS